MNLLATLVLVFCALSIPLSASARFIEGEVDVTFAAESPDSAEVKWKGIDLETGMAIDEPRLRDAKWQIRLRQAYVSTNLGDIARIETSNFSSVKEAPADPQSYKNDTTYDGPGPAPIDRYNETLMTWYSYNLLHHLMLPKPYVFVLKTAIGSYAKLQFVDYVKNGEALRVRKTRLGSVVWPQKVGAEDGLVHVKLRYKINTEPGSRALD